VWRQCWLPAILANKLLSAASAITSIVWTDVQNPYLNARLRNALIWPSNSADRKPWYTEIAYRNFDSTIASNTDGTVSSTTSTKLAETDAKCSSQGGRQNVFWVRRTQCLCSKTASAAGTPVHSGGKGRHRRHRATASDGWRCGIPAAPRQSQQPGTGPLLVDGRVVSSQITLRWKSYTPQ